MKSNNQITEKQIKEFLITVYFGPHSDHVKSSSRRAYRDFCRTLDFGNAFDGMDKNAIKNEKTALKVKVEEVFEKDLLPGLSSVSTQDQYDNLHKKDCGEIKRIYAEKGITITYGHTQKWVNMFLKYYCVFHAEELNSTIQFYHIPIDSYNMKNLKENYGVEKLQVAWSSLDDYEVYLDYQNKVRKAVVTESKYKFPMDWEFTEWSNAE